MSLINKMLQDLDARGGVGDDAADSRAVKAVPAAERERRPLVLAAVAGTALALLVAGAWYGQPRWQEWRRHGATAAPAPLVVVEPARPILLPEPASGSALAPAAAPAQSAGIAPLSPITSLAATAPVDGGTAQPRSALRRGADMAPASAGPSSAAERQAAPRPRRVATDADARVGEGRPAPSDGVSRREITPKVESDSAYRRALVALQEGRVSVAMADLERAVEIDPRNESARQTYVSLLLENNRADEAIRQLRLSLGVEPRQPALAMVLARLQLERGGPALATLMKTLPHAARNADYLAFLAGVLQREQRHADAVRYYRDALQIAPNNGVWWMGLGISLQADQRPSEAREAYARARASAGMTAELQAFLDRKLEQLAH